MICQKLKLRVWLVGWWDKTLLQPTNVEKQSAVLAEKSSLLLRKVNNVAD
jgi:hypothetical protein